MILIKLNEKCLDSSFSERQGIILHIYSYFYIQEHTSKLGTHLWYTKFLLRWLRKILETNMSNKIVHYVIREKCWSWFPPVGSLPLLPLACVNLFCELHTVYFILLYSDLNCGRFIDLESVTLNFLLFFQFTRVTQKKQKKKTSVTFVPLHRKESEHFS